MKKSICIFNNIPSPYRRALFDEIYEQAESNNVDFSVIYLSSKETVRDWEVDIRKFEKVLPVLWRKRAFKTTTSDTIINTGFIYDALTKKHVILFGYNYATYLLVAIIRVIMRKPTYLFCESTLHDKPGKTLKKNIKSFIIRCFFKEYFVPGKSSKNYLLEHKVDPKKIHIAMNASPLKPDKINIADSNNVLRILFVGRLSPEKRILEFTKTFNKLNTEHELTIVGHGEDYQAISNISNENSKIQMLGSINHNKLSDIYKSHDALVLVSESETWGLVVNEAINHGLSILLSPNVGSGPDLLDGNGVYIDELNGEGLLRVLELLSLNKLKYKKRSLDIAKTVTVKEQASAFLNSINFYNN